MPAFPFAFYDKCHRMRGTAMRQLGFLLMVLADTLALVPAARAEGLSLDLSPPRGIPHLWSDDPGRWSVTGYALQAPPSSPSFVIGFGAFGLVGRDGGLDARLDLDGAQMELSADLTKLVITFKKKF